MIMDNIVSAIRKDRPRMWIFALLMGVVFKYAFGYSKYYMWSWMFTGDIGIFNNWLIDLSPTIYIIALNAIVDITSSLPASALVGYILVKIYPEKEITYCFGTIGVFLIINAHIWYSKIIAAPNLALQISSLQGRFITALVLLLATYFFTHLKKTKRINAYTFKAD
jgi:hypothetical protein